MSRVGKQPVTIPTGVKAVIAGQLLKVEGPKGKLQRNIREEITVKEESGTLVFERKEDTKASRSFHGLERALARNMVEGVSTGFSKELALVGVGYKVEVAGKNVILNLGYSHPIDFPLPEGVKAEVIKDNRDSFLKLESVDRQLVGQVAAQIRSLRPPEPYKGKGVRYKDENVRRKAGKAGKK